MTRPAPTETVPVEPDAGLLSVISAMVRRIAVPVSVEDEEVYFDNGHARQIYQAVIQSAPAAPQTAGVGDREAIAREVHKGRFPSDREATPFDQESREAQAYCYRITDRILALRAPSRKPEGGAVSIWSAARSLFVRYAELFAMTERYEEASAIADKAAREIEALATREEAPTEAGVPSLVDWFSQFIERHQEGCGSDTDALIACLDRVRDSYRAQPPAREDALPVSCQSCGGEIQGWACQGCDMTFCERDGRLIAEHPAPDALRVAVEALLTLPELKRRQEHLRKGIGTATDEGKVVLQALAALQAEQKGGA